MMTWWNATPITLTERVYALCFPQNLVPDGIKALAVVEKMSLVTRHSTGPMNCPSSRLKSTVSRIVPSKMT